MTTITKALKRIEDDILQVLSEANGESLTQDQLFQRTHLVHTAEYGWTFALENLEKQKKIEVTGYDLEGYLKYQLRK